MDRAGWLWSQPLIVLGQGSAEGGNDDRVVIKGKEVREGNRFSHPRVSDIADEIIVSVCDPTSGFRVKVARA